MKTCSHTCRKGDECEECEGIITWKIAIGIFIAVSTLILLHSIFSSGGP